MKHTPLFDRHARDASMLINLKGVARPLEYRGHMAEHRATREAVTLCDVSHMGELDVAGPDALTLVQRLITNDAARLDTDQALYSVMCDADGFVIDDLVCLRLGTEQFLLVVNVTKTEEDFAWALAHAREHDVEVRNRSAETALMALQGPESREVLQRVCAADLAALDYYRLVQTTVHTDRAEVPCIVSRTGYTGEWGYEVMVARELAPWVWDTLLDVGRPLGIMAHGVAARESLRTEAGYLLNGNDMDARTDPFEAGVGWTVKLTKEDFVGKAALLEKQARGVSRRLVALEVLGPQTIRYGDGLHHSDREVGRVTSGPLPASLAGRNLGLGYVAIEHAEPGTELEVEVLGRRCPARVVELPPRARRVRAGPSVSTYSPYALGFSSGHAWVHAADDDGDGTVVIGLSDFGQRRLGDVLAVELPAVGEQIVAGAPACRLESYRVSFGLVAPLSGEVVAVDERAAVRPTHVNAYPYDRGGLLRVRPTTPPEPGALMEYADYRGLVDRLRSYDHWTQEQRTT